MIGGAPRPLRAREPRVVTLRVGLRQEHEAANSHGRAAVMSGIVAGSGHARVAGSGGRLGLAPAGCARATWLRPCNIPAALSVRAFADAGALRTRNDEMSLWVASHAEWNDQPMLPARGVLPPTCVEAS